MTLDRKILGCLGIFIESTVTSVDVKLSQSYSDRGFYALVLQRRRLHLLGLIKILYGNILPAIYTLYLTSEINVNLMTILLFYAPINKLFLL